MLMLFLEQKQKFCKVLFYALSRIGGFGVALHERWLRIEYKRSFDF
jgi:hypothetical protein